MQRSLKLKRGRAVLIRLPHTINSLHPPGYHWHIGKIVAIRKEGVRVAVIDSGTFESVRTVELSHCVVWQYCSLGMEIFLFP